MPHGYGRMVMTCGRMITIDDGYFKNGFRDGNIRNHHYMGEKLEGPWKLNFGYVDQDDITDRKYKNGEALDYEKKLIETTDTSDISMEFCRQFNRQ